MSIKTTNDFCRAVICCIAALYFFSCSSPASKEQQTNQELKPQFALYLLNKETPVDFILLNTLDSGTLQERAAVPSANFNREYIVKGKSVFLLNQRTNYFVRYQLGSDNKLFAKDSVFLDKTGDVENFHWQNNSDTLFLFTVKRENASKGYVHIINSSAMSLLKQETLPLPSAIGDFNLLNIGLSDVSDNQLWLGYSYSKYLPNDDYTTIDTMYFSTIDLGNFSVKKVQKDIRSSYPGGINTVQSYAAKNEAGDLYFMSCPGIALGNNTKAPTALFRKRKNADVVDPDYMIDISAAIKNHAYGFWYIGQQQAIIRSERKDRYTDFSNHHSTYQFEYYLVDLNAGTLTKMDLPFDKGTRKENVLVDGELVYIGVDDSDDNHRIWQYNSRTKQTKEALSLSKSIDFILRIDRLF